jgi:DNA invertase Pin-like site-specific DNA recombinase
MKILPYVRVSTDKQDTERQKVAISDFATNMGHELLPWVEEESGISGRSKAVKASHEKALRYYANVALGSSELLERPGLAVLLETVRHRLPGAVALYSLDRLSRDCCELLLLERYLASLNCFLIALNQGGIVDTRTAAGKFMFRVLAAQAEMECDLVSERTKQSLKVRKESGKRIGGRPLGWRKVDGAWVENADEQMLMREARKLYAESCTYRDINLSNPKPKGNTP